MPLVRKNETTHHLVANERSNASNHLQKTSPTNVIL